MLPLTGLTAACGNVLLRKPAPSLVAVRPRSPLTPVAFKFATVVAAPKLLPWLVDVASWMDAAVPLPPCSQKIWMWWSVPTTTLLPCTVPLAIVVAFEKDLPAFVDFVNTILGVL